MAWPAPRAVCGPPTGLSMVRGAGWAIHFRCGSTVRSTSRRVNRSVTEHMQGAHDWLNGWTNDWAE
eukprot:2473146-Alexandrium_andersonii.AAC.1